MRKLFWWIRHYIEGKIIWNAKMSEPLYPILVYRPGEETEDKKQKTKDKKQET
jgi:hypothetical protein